MKYTNIAALLLSATTVVSAFRDQTQLKPNRHDPRRLQQKNFIEAPTSCPVNHDLAQSEAEVDVKIDVLPRNDNNAGALFKATMQADFLSPNTLTTFAWCVDIDRNMDNGDYSMDIFSAYDGSIRVDAVDKPEFFPNLAWLINNINVGDEWPSSGDDCAGGTITWTEMQNAVWRVIDDRGETYEYNYLGDELKVCVAEEMAAQALQFGDGYELDCTDPNELMPLILIVDEGDNGKIQKQVLVSETPLIELEGFCDCPTPSPTVATPSPTVATPAPTVTKTNAPTPQDRQVGPTPVFKAYECPEEETETAFAYEDGAACFLDDANLGSSRWGWTIELDGSGGTYDVYAGAGGCNLNNGEKVGEITVTYDSDAGTCTGEYTAMSGKTIEEFQFYCGTTMYPQKNDEDSVAPGDYPCKVEVGEIAAPGDSAECVVEDVGEGTLYAIAHFVSCGSVVAGTPSPTGSPETPATPAPTDAPETPAPTDAPETPAPTDAPETPAPTDAPETPAPTDAPETPAPTDAPETPAPTDAPETPAPTDAAETPAPTDAPETPAPTDAPETPAPTDAPETPAPTDAPETPAPSPPPTKASGSGDPHFKTWTGDKFDYHGECDLVLVDNPSFMDGKGLRIHIRTTRVKYFSYIEKIAVQIGGDVLEFANDVDNFLINGEVVEPNQKHHKTYLGGIVLRRDPRAVSIRVHDEGRKHHDGAAAKIDLHTRKNGFPAVIVDGGATDVFKGSLGLLGEWESGRRLARDGTTELNDTDATAFALEWQVREHEPMLFQDARAPQWPTVCTPPAKMTGNRLGMDRMKKEAEKACAHWEEDIEDCIFDVIATRDVLVAEEGHFAKLS